MPDKYLTMSMSLLQNYLTTQRFLYQKNSRHTTNTFGMDNSTLYNSHPRFPFEYYIRINLNNVGTARNYIGTFYNAPMWDQVSPLVKTVELPNIKIDTDVKNQYNRKRISQTKINFEPVKLVFHDVADGKTLKFWEMYYRYYFADGNEPGMNIAREVDSTVTMEMQRSISAGTTGSDTNYGGMPGALTASGTGVSATNNAGNKRDLQNIVANTLDNHLFGYNLSKVANIRNLIASIDIFQVHAGRYNQTTLVNPRISAFTHDTLNYTESSKTLEVTFLFEYEYAYYTVHNMHLGGQEPNNESSLEPFRHGQQLEIPSITFTATLNDHLESNNPILSPESAAILNGKNVQDSLDSVMQAFPDFEDIRRVSSSVLDGMVELNRSTQTALSAVPGLQRTLTQAVSQADRAIQSRTFQSAAVRRVVDSMYRGLA